jgi:hypothetical protein
MLLLQINIFHGVSYHNMASNYVQGIYVPKHPEKYIGRRSIRYRSSWEFAFMTFLDNHPSILSWASESVRIPYRNPLNGKNTTYVPDFLIVYQDKNGQSHCELIEIKPSKEIAMEAAKTRHDKLKVAINMSKWQAARAWCSVNNIQFRIVSERELFAGTK